MRLGGGGEQLEDANLTGAGLSGANLSGANLSGVDLSEVIGLTPEQIRKARIDDRTVLPFDRSLLNTP